jgi:hypothetical protein
MTFGESDRFEPDEARRFMETLTFHMRKRANDLAQRRGSSLEQSEDKCSVQQQYYGDKWKLLYGITKGVQAMKASSERVFEDDPDGWKDPREREVHWEISDSEWQEHYEEYGYGPYGRGLEIGKRLAFYSDHSFDFTAETGDDTPSTESQSTDEESGFTFTNYGEE